MSSRVTRYPSFFFIILLGYEELLPHSSEMLIRSDFRARVLNLETLIEIKEQLGGEKDRAMLPVLRRTLEEKSR